ncbi:hypothetical protein KPL74_20735 [Bacillus sp. NP157]|nr:hypothetical protein KPL74_20735 [Bacillus sp. NP157]
MRAIHLVFDYVVAMKKAGIGFDAIERRDDLEVAFKRSGVDPHRSVGLDELFLEIESDTSVSARSVSSLAGTLGAINGSLVFERVPSLAAHAFYSFESVYPQIEAVRDVVDGELGDRAVASVIRRAIRGASDRYTILEFARELCAALFFALDVAAPIQLSLPSEHLALERSDLSASPEPVRALPESSVDEILGNLVPITRHSYLASVQDVEGRRRYIESLAIVLAPQEAIDKEQRSYLASLGRAFGCRDVLRDTEIRIGALDQEYVEEVIELVREPTACMAWLTDAAFLLTLADERLASSRAKIVAIGKALNLPASFVGELIDQVGRLADESSVGELNDLIKTMSVHSMAWKVIVDFRKVSFRGAFEKELAGLVESDGVELGKLRDELRALKGEVDECGELSGEVSDIFRKNFSRKFVVSSFDSLKAKVRAHALTLESGMAPAQASLVAFGLVDAEFPSSSDRIPEGSKDVEAPAWKGAMTSAVKQLEWCLDELVSQRALLSRLLGEVERGNW